MTQESNTGNILTPEIILTPYKLNKSGLTQRQGEFLLDTLVNTFGEVRIPESTSIKGDMYSDHPVVWMLLDSTGKELRDLFDLCLEISITKNIPNHKEVLKRIKQPLDYVGARAEIHIGSWIRTATKEVQFIFPQGIQKEPDFEIKMSGHFLYVEVKGSSETDFEVGVNMFNGWIRSCLIEFFSKGGFRYVVRFGAYWIDGVGAACNINEKIENASWAFHSAISSLVSQASFLIGNNLKSSSKGVIKIEPDIEIVNLGPIQDGELSVIIELPPAKRVASIGNIIQKLTNKSNIEKFHKGNGIFAFYTREAIDEMLGRQLLDTLLMQCPQLNKSLIGIAIFNSEGKPPIFIQTYIFDNAQKWKEDAFRISNYFKKPEWDENSGNPIIP